MEFVAQYASLACPNVWDESRFTCLSLSVADVPDHEISQKRYHSSGSFVEINRETEVRADRNNFLHFGGIDELIVASLFKRGMDIYFLDIQDGLPMN